MTKNEHELINIIRESKNPEKAVLTAIDLIVSYAKLHASYIKLHASYCKNPKTANINCLV